MKNIILLFLILLSLQTFGQDVVYNFNSSIENFEQGGMPGLTATDGALINATWSDSYQFVRTPAGLEKTETNYKKIRVVVENSTNITVFQVLNFDSGSTSAGVADKTDVTIAAVALNSGFTTYDIDFPANSSNSGTIDRLGFRAKGAITSGTLRIAQIVLIETGNWVTNNNFETSSNWTASGADVTAGFTTTDPQEGTQSCTLTFTADQVENKFLVSATTDFGESVSPTDINTTLWVKSTTPGALVSLLYSLRDATGAYLDQISTGSHTISTADTWELATFNKSNLTKTFNQVLLKIKVVGGLDGTVISFDDVQPSIILVATDNSWTGGKDTEWTDIANWTNGVASTATKDSNVQVSANNPIISATTGATVKNLDVGASAALTVASGQSLTVTGDFTNNGTVTLNSDADEFASIIVQGSSSGDIVYNRYVNTVGTAEWDLIGSPVDGLSISSFVTTNSTPLATSGSIYAVGEYDNSDNSWTNYTSSTVGAAGNFDIGRGYQMATSSGATVAFTGTVATTDQTQSIINNAGNGGRRWNLVANPYPSYLNANTNAHASNNFLSVNSGVIDSNFSAIYGYDADGSGYTIYNNTNAATYIAPGQAFFVAAASSSAANLSFTEAMQTTTGGDDFIAGRLANTSSELYLKLYEGENLVDYTKFYFDNNLSLGLDPGYDAGAYNQSSALASRLAEDDQGVNMGINAMGIDSFEQTTIPLVVNKEAGTSFRISLEDLTIPESVEVVLEDTETQTFTDLRAGDFTLNPQSDLSGMGRFYLRLGNTSLGGSDLEESYISIYNPVDKDYITIEGLASIQKANVRLYNIIGQEILSKTLQTGQSTQSISTAGLTTGIYVIKLEVDSTLISKKIVIN